MSTIRILIVDDHAVVRKGLALVLRLEPGFEVVGETGAGDEVLALAAALRPDVILLDRVLPGLDGRTVTAAVKTALPATRVLILTGAEVDESVTDIIAAGADGYVLKEIEPAELKQAIRAVARGEAYLQPAVARRVMDALIRRRQPQPAVALTPREREVLQYMAAHATYREIAARLIIGEETVRSHAKSILSKLNQPDRARAVEEARRLGLLPPL